MDELNRHFHHFLQGYIKDDTVKIQFFIQRKTLWEHLPRTYESMIHEKYVHCSIMKLQAFSCLRVTLNHVPRRFMDTYA